jgi:CRAL/TRIO domain/CRAL/TRIO, N-terminal domain
MATETSHKRFPPGRGYLEFAYKLFNLSMHENTEGRLGFLTPSQEQDLLKFKQELGPLFDPKFHDDHLLLRFLRARQFKIPAAMEMFKKWIAWRLEFKTDDILQEFDFPEYLQVRTIYPRIYHKTDKLGRPVYIERFGTVDIKKLWAATTSERMVRNHVYEYEKLIKYRFPACSAKAGRYFEQSTTILDLKGVNLSSFRDVYSLVTQVSSIGQDYYPELLGKMFIINAPMLFTATWVVIKQMLDERTVKKISILGSTFKPQLLEYIDEANLPDFLGGGCKCAGGCTNADIGPW